MTKADLTVPSDSILHITVGAAPNPKLDLTHELQLVKAALLYADKVKLCSISSSAMVLLSFIGTLDEDGIMELIVQTAESLGQDPQNVTSAMELYKSLRRKKHRSRQELLTLGRAKQNLDKARAELKRVAETTIVEAGGNGLAAALNSGLVEFQWFDISSSKVAEEYFAAIADSLMSGSTYPLLDDFTSDLVNAAIKENKLLPLGTTVSRAKQVGLSSGLFSRLPVFDVASVDEVIDIRKELDRPLTRFRSAMIKFSRDIENAPWEQGFPEEVEQVFLEHVEPAVLEIEEAYKSNKPLLALLSKFAEKPLVLPSSSALGLLISQASQLPSFCWETLFTCWSPSWSGVDVLTFVR